MAKKIIHRFVPAILALALLSGCSAGPQEPPTTAQDAETILRVMAAYQEVGEGTDALTWLTDPQEVEDYSLAYYKVEGITDGAIVRMEGANAFELAILETQEAVTDQLQQYLVDRKGDFVGYAPDQAALIDDAIVLNAGEWFALAICQKPDMAQAAFESCFGRGVNAHGIPAVLGPSPEDYRPDGRLIYNDPQIDDMTVFDNSAILSAWRNGDTSSLSRSDKKVLVEAEKVIGKYITSGMSDAEKEITLYLWLVRNTEYDKTHYSNKGSPRTSYEPYGPLVQKKGVCLGYTTAFQLLMDMAGVECITVTGASYMNRENHAWNMVRLGGEWYCVDPTWEDIPAGGTIEDAIYFNVTSDHMAETDHQWDYDSVPEATAKWKF